MDADTRGKVTREEISNMINFCSHAFSKIPSEDKEAVLQKMNELNLSGPPNGKTTSKINAMKAQLNDEEKRALEVLQARPVLRFEHSMNIDFFDFIVIDGLKISLPRGALGLVKAKLPPGPPKAQATDIMGLMMGDGKLNT